MAAALVRIKSSRELRFCYRISIYNYIANYICFTACPILLFLIILLIRVMAVYYGGIMWQPVVNISNYILLLWIFYKKLKKSWTRLLWYTIYNTNKLVEIYDLYASHICFKGSLNFHFPCKWLGAQFIAYFKVVIF